MGHRTGRESVRKTEEERVMKNQRVKVGIIVVLCTFLICIAGCSKEEKEQESPEQKTLTTVLEMLFTVPDQKLQDAYM